MSAGDVSASRAHATAIYDLLRAHTPYPVHLGEPAPEPDQQDLTYPYLVVWPPPVDRMATTRAGWDGNATTATQVTAVGREPTETLYAMDRAAAALHARRPAIDGRRCGLIRQTPSASPPQPLRDDTVRILPEGRRPFYTFALFTLLSTAVRPEEVTHG